MINFEATEDGVLTISRNGQVVSQVEVTEGSVTSFVGDYTFEAGATLPDEVDAE